MLEINLSCYINIKNNELVFFKYYYKKNIEIFINNFYFIYNKAIKYIYQKFYN